MTRLAGLDYSFNYFSNIVKIDQNLAVATCTPPIHTKLLNVLSDTAVIDTDCTGHFMLIKAYLENRKKDKESNPCQTTQG